MKGFVVNWAQRQTASGIGEYLSVFANINTQINVCSGCGGDWCNSGL